MGEEPNRKTTEDGLCRETNFLLFLKRKNSLIMKIDRDRWEITLLMPEGKVICHSSNTTLVQDQRTYSVILKVIR